MNQMFSMHIAYFSISAVLKRKYKLEKAPRKRKSLINFALILVVGSCCYILFIYLKNKCAHNFKRINLLMLRLFASILSCLKI